MKAGVALFFTQYSISPSQLAVALEERGFESIWAPEHSHIPLSRNSVFPKGGELPERYQDVMDPFVTLSVAAAVTTSLKIATGICLVVQRDPIQTAKSVASLDQISSGRFLFGVGAGWNAEEMRNHGTEFKTRMPLLQERIEAMREIWANQQASYHGKFVNFSEIISNPKPIQNPHPPIIVGGAFPYGARRAIAYGDGWIPHAKRPAYSSVIDKFSEFRKMATSAGRNPDSLPITVFGIEEDLDRLPRYRDAGVERVVFSLPSNSSKDTLPLLDKYAFLIRDLN
jgi:probable F420-dependent oxidoreductase